MATRNWVTFAYNDGAWDLALVESMPRWWIAACRLQLTIVWPHYEEIAARESHVN